MFSSASPRLPGPRTARTPASCSIQAPWVGGEVGVSEVQLPFALGDRSGKSYLRTDPTVASQLHFRQPHW